MKSQLHLIWLLPQKKQQKQTLAEKTLSKSLINDSPIDISERFTNHLQQQVLFLQTELKNKDNYIKNLLLQLSKQSNIIYCFQNQSNHKHIIPYLWVKLGCSLALTISFFRVVGRVIDCLTLKLLFWDVEK